MNGHEYLRLLQSAPDYENHPLHLARVYETNRLRYVIQSLHISGVDMNDPTAYAPEIAQLMKRFDAIAGKVMLEGASGSDQPDVARLIADYLLDALPPDISRPLRDIPVGIVCNDVNIFAAERILTIWRYRHRDRRKPV